MQGNRHGSRLLFAAWLAGSLAIAALFFHDHPPRPVFGMPVRSEETVRPWAAHAASLSAALLYAALLFATGAGAARLLRLSRPPDVALFGLGLLLASLAAFLLLALGLFRAHLFGPLLLLPALFARRRQVGALSFPRFPRGPAAAASLLGAVILLALLVRSLAPLTANDPIVYHMTLARDYATTGRFAGAPDLVYARMPHGGDLLLAGAYLFGGEGGGRVFYLIILAASALLAARIARTITGGRGGVGAAVLFLSLPLVVDPRSIGNADLTAAFFFGASLLLLLRHRDEGRRADLVASSLLAGGMLAVKYATYAAYPLLLALLATPLFPGRRGGGKAILLFLAISHGPLAIWLVKAWAETGNPLFPLFPRLLGGEGWDPVLGERLVAWQRSIGMGRGPLRFLILPWNAILRGARGYPFFDGVLSPTLLAWTFWAALRGGRAARFLLPLALAGIYLWGIGPEQLRFLLPVVLLLTAVTGAFWRSEKGVAGTVQALLFLAIAAGTAAPFVVETVRDTAPVVCGRERPRDYRERKIQSYEAFGKLPLVVPGGEKILLVWENRVYYAPRPYRADSFFEASEVIRLAERTGTAEAFLDSLRQEEIGWVLVNRPLGRIFARHAPPGAARILDEAWSLCEPRGAWKGLVLYRIPERPSPREESGRERIDRIAPSSSPPRRR